MRTFNIYSLSNFQYTVLLTIVSMLYITPAGPIYLIAGSLYLLTSFTHFCLPSLWQPPICSLYLWVCCLFVCFLFFVFSVSTYKWDHIVFVFLWFTSLSIIPSRSIHVVTNGKISFFVWLNNIPMCVHVYFLCPFIHWWTLRLLPLLGYCE